MYLSRLSVHWLRKEKGCEQDISIYLSISISIYSSCIYLGRQCTGYGKRRATNKSYLSIYLSTYVSIYLSRPSVHWQRHNMGYEQDISIYLSISISIYLSMYLSRPSVHWLRKEEGYEQELSIYQSIYISI